MGATANWRGGIAGGAGGCAVESRQPVRWAVGQGHRQWPTAPRGAVRGKPEV
ncbi:MAG: hypothetical protein KME26_08495 [Oscillatoria princeps RMCB-10]|nr:hypothetical protein [Oscillatoria princeps RMCB-10]